MRTLKKVLALSLVFAMAFTLMAGAAYKDEDSIDSSLRDDITLLEALGVFQGDENGNFNPTNNVTRAEAAKMIYVLKNNGVDDKAVAFQGVATFSDVPVGHWAEGYVNYCANLGIMAGWTENGQKVFNPSGNVTGVELTKMLLCLVGYKADVQGYTNNNAWKTNVLMDGANAGITNNYTPSVYAAAPRQWTARLMVNAINAPFVTYNRGEIMYGTADDPTLSYGRNYLRLSIAEGTLTATNTVRVQNGSVDKDTSKFTKAAFADTLRGTNQDDVTVYVTEINNHQNTDNKPYGSTVYEDIDADNALLGQKVKVYYRTANFTDTKPTEVFAVLADSSEKVVNTTVDQISFSSTNDKRMTVADEGAMTYSQGNHEIAVYEDNAQIGTGYDKTSLQDLGLGVKSSDAVKLIYDEDGYVVKAFISKAPVYAVVDEIDAENGVLRLVDAGSGVVNLYDANNTRITFNRSNSDNFDKYLNIDSSVAAEDVVKITRNVSTGELKYDVTVLNAVNSNVQSYTTDTVKDESNKDVDVYDVMTIDGTEYKLSKYAMDSYDWTLDSGNAGHDTFYVDGSYVVYSTGESDSASISNLAYVYATGASADSFGSATLRVKALLADGTKGSYVLNKSTGIGDAANDGKNYDGKLVDGATADKVTNDQRKTALEDYVGKIYTYSLKDNTITLKKITNDTNALNGNRATYITQNDEISFVDENDTVKVNGSEYVVNDSTYFFVKDVNEDGDDQYAVVKASELKDDLNSATKANVFVAQNISGFKTILAGFVETTKGNGVVTTEAEDYYFVTGSPKNMGENADGDYIIELPVNAAGTDTTLTFKYSDESSSKYDMATLNAFVGKLVNVDLDSDGTVASATDVKVVTLGNNKDEWTQGELTAWSSTRATVGGVNYKVAEDVKIYNVDVNDKNDKATFEGEGSAVKAALVDEDDAKKGYQKNAVFVKNTDDEITAIFTEIDGADISFIVTTAE